ncbi:MAG: type II toxin-antitoxin system RelE/ParE family toxin [Pseudomonadota bacterium]
MGYQLTRKARDDLLDVFDYGLLRYGENSAIRYRESLFQLFDRLDQFPEIGVALEHGDNRRRFPHWPYLIFYKTIDGHILITGIKHGRQDWKDVES